ncbi:MAG: 2-oxoisovalerate dehydrogenase [Nostoc sp. NOS(2021)]|uniref:2-oxoisovalerate dehydrogenase E1 subunit beta n=1 Tax=Nostoc sp. NOS(2021) TaxID=2815407 RepID=UPI0025FC2978|nr:2-oxoisovalerate dehydrogenase E1 subunit beta [Nostoc sp. NOS(2021)]MBN3899399.1 2-oxoisovalerate dehydrogenase [Nostoc sp. NOS(2021)]
MSQLTEIVFLVEDDPDGGYTARALGESIFTEADDLKSLKIMVKDAVNCHFENLENRPKIIRLHIVKDEVFAL